MTIVLVGPPAVGKGTISRMLSKAYKMPVISTGELFRSEIASGSELGKLAASYINEGHFVPDDITVKLACKEILARGGGCFIDGFPRNVKQAKAFDAMCADNGITLDGVLCFYAPDKILIDRISKRSVCSVCQKPYHDETIIPKVEGICDECGGKIVRRADDSPECAKARIDAYYRVTAPMVNYYERLGKVYIVDSYCSIGKQFEYAESAISKMRRDGF
jgi:adenylate kinase